MSKPRAALGHLAADAPKAEDAQRGVMDVGPEQQHRAPRLPAVLADVVVALGDAPRGGHQQGKGGVGGRLGQHARRYCRRRRRGGCRPDVDVVEADREVADHLELRPGAIEQLVVDSSVTIDSKPSTPATRRSSSSRGGGQSSGQTSASVCAAMRARPSSEIRRETNTRGRASEVIGRTTISPRAARTVANHAAWPPRSEQRMGVATEPQIDARYRELERHFATGKRSRTASTRTSTSSRTTARAATPAARARRCTCWSRSRSAASCAGTSATPRSASATGSFWSPATPSR